MAKAAQLSGDARASIPHDVQQIIVVDYRAMQNSPAAMQLEGPGPATGVEAAGDGAEDLGSEGGPGCGHAGLCGVPAPIGQGSDGTRILGIAQGQFHYSVNHGELHKAKDQASRCCGTTRCIPMGSAGMSVVFLNQTTMVFGDKDAVKAALDARDGLAPNFLQNGDMMNDMAMVDSHAGVEPSGPEGHADDDEERAG